MTARRVALYGGSFNPPHLCHTLVATYALTLGAFDEVRLVPVFSHPFGKVLAPFAARMEMASAAVAHLGERVTVSDIESKLTHDGPTFTVHTVDAARAAEPDTAFTWIVGSDAYEHRAKWHQWDRLASMVDFLVLGRDGYEAPPGVAVTTVLPNVSSTEIRRRVAAGEPTWSMIAPAVRSVVDRERLYR